MNVPFSEYDHFNYSNIIAYQIVSGSVAFGEFVNVCVCECECRIIENRICGLLEYVFILLQPIFSVFLWIAFTLNFFLHIYPIRCWCCFFMFFVFNFPFGILFGTLHKPPYTLAVRFSFIIPTIRSVRIFPFENYPLTHLDIHRFTDSKHSIDVLANVLVACALPIFHLFVSLTYIL